ncbi:MAG TPA: N-acetyl-gamma-glutamyl-phosphate reductase [Fimbriimonadaceae bacterium]|nr:N-acetyl-gamma-glutamyl-phosphate reductase [Fimbriimonadaceae bacterium]
MSSSKRVAIVGATGYGGAELVRLLSMHPQAEITLVTSERKAGERLDSECPWLASDLVLEKFNPDKVEADFVFLAQEAGFAMAHVGRLLQSAKVIDLSADFRLRNKEVYESTYKRPWCAPGVSVEPVYGLPEAVDRAKIAGARLVANPGCHATNAILGLKPILKFLDGTPVVDSKSGVSGAGRSRMETDYLFSEMTGNFKAYALTGHRHIPEIEQEIGTPIRFTPHLIPESRGIYTTIHAPLRAGTSLPDLQSQYVTSTFVRTVPRIPSTKQVLGSNRVDIHVDLDSHTQFAVISVVSDNLVKGAAGQAIQNMNLMAGFPEALGLPIHGVWP